MKRIVLFVSVVALAAGLQAAAPAADEPAGTAAPAAAPAAPARPVVIYTRESVPPTPKLADLPLKDKVSQHGVTWTFDKPVPCGQFITGDWYVVGPATVKAIDPKPLMGKEVQSGEPWTAVVQLDARRKPLKDANGKDVVKLFDVEEIEEKDAKGQYLRNGSVVNPPPVMGKSGFDSRPPFHMYDPAITAKLPIELKPGDALISSISKKRLVRQGHYTPISTLAVLTCLKEPVPADAFRPGFMDRKQEIYLARNLKRELLPKLAVPEFDKKAVLTMPQLTDHFVRPWQLLNVFKGDHGDHQWAGYGQRSCFYAGQAFLHLVLDSPPAEKEPLLQAMVQWGIECWGVVKSGHPGFWAWGGWNSGYKMPIVFAGVLLGDEVMASPSKAYPKCSFQEDEQTAYGPCWNGAKVVFCGHSGYEAATLKSRDKYQRGSVWGFYEHLHPSRWIADQVQSDGYRRCCNSRTWQAQALVMRIMKLETYWAHDAFFDYMDRWMYQSEDEEGRFETTSKANVRVGWEPMKDWAKQGQVEDKFAEAMWKKYRTAPGMPPTDGWKTLKKNENGLVMPDVQGPVENPDQPTSAATSTPTPKPAATSRPATSRPRRTAA